MYIPSAVSPREIACLQKYARDKVVTEVGALLGHSTIQLAKVAREVISIDRHSGYDNAPNSTLSCFLRNLDISGVRKRVTPIIGDFSLMRRFPADFVFIDLDGTYITTMRAIRYAIGLRAPIIGVHDFGRTNCKGVAWAVKDSGLQVLERADSLIILKGK